jgi:hypothetical protein
LRPANTGIATVADVGFELERGIKRPQVRASAGEGMALKEVTLQSPAVRKTLVLSQSCRTRKK